MSDSRVALARQAHQDSLQSEAEADLHRQKRNELVRALRAEDPQTWTYKRLGEAVGCSLELIHHIVKTE